MKPRKALLNSVQAYYRTLKEFEFQRAFHEGAVSVAFQTLLSDVGRPHGWTLIPQLSDKRAGGGIRPDGTLKDQMNLVRGHWEAKDTSDNLDVEIIKKSKKGYPLTNIIFEDTRTAVLLQNKTEVMRVDLKNPAQLVDLLDLVFGYVEPQIEGLRNAVNEFKDRVPELARALISARRSPSSTQRIDLGQLRRFLAMTVPAILFFARAEWITILCNYAG